MTREWLESKQAEINRMGKTEVAEYKAKVINSCADNPTKFFLYDIIDERLEALRLENSLAVGDDGIDLSTATEARWAND